ncbi:MAG: bacillithiol biosynthesis deacetylase BshB1 [Planctomycetes bacterium]|nr:bacillithiol biosynthesis deacetylase BshB1 [Planctomycetota bacterium]
MIDVLAIGAHPDDIELFAGGTLAHFQRRGSRIGLLHLTRGESASRGSPELRATEARAAADVLGASQIRILDLGDGALRDDDRSRAAVIGVLREWTPRLVLAQLPSDDHPDHAAAGAIAKSAWYLAGIRNVAPGSPPHRPRALWFFPCHEVPHPNFVVTVTAADFDRKKAALACYDSQFVRRSDTAVLTRISDPAFLDGMHARARAWGSMIGSPFGEPFVLPGPLPVDDPQALLR